MELQRKLLKHMSVLKDVTPSGPSGCMFCSAALVGFLEDLAAAVFRPKALNQQGCKPNMSMCREIFRKRCTQRQNTEAEDQLS